MVSHVVGRARRSQVQIRTHNVIVEEYPNRFPEASKYISYIGAIEIQSILQLEDAVINH